MSKQLNGVEFPHQARWLDRDNPQPIAQSVDRTVGGNLVRYEQRLRGGRPITIAFNEGECWVTRAQMETWLSMAAQLQHEYFFVWDDFMAKVAFRLHEDPAVDLRGINTTHGEYVDDPAQSVYVGQIKLMTLE